MRKITFLLILVSSTAILASPENIHKWFDKEGNIYYGDRPPPAARHEVIKVKKSRAYADEEQSRESSRDPTGYIPDDSPWPATDDYQDESAFPVDHAKIACEKAREELDIIKRSSRIQTRSADGTSRYLTTDEVKARRQSAQEAIELNC